MKSKFVLSRWHKLSDSGFVQLAALSVVSVSSPDRMNRWILRTVPVFASSKKCEKGEVKNVGKSAYPHTSTQYEDILASAVSTTTKYFFNPALMLARAVFLLSTKQNRHLVKGIRM
jgi:hypothetical protein